MDIQQMKSRLTQMTWAERRDLSKKAGVPFWTIQALAKIKGSTQDPRLSTYLALQKALTD